jgi:tellurite resistance protein TerC
MPPKKALRWVVIWFLAAMAFAAGLILLGDRKIYIDFLNLNLHWEKALGFEFLTCYIIEWTLSIDNLFVFLMIFEAFGVDPHRQLRALKWGIIGAIVMRLVFIFVGVTVVSLFEPILYIFGLILIWSAYKMAFKEEEEVDVKESWLVKKVQKLVPMTGDFVGSKFFVRGPGGMMATPMLLVLVAIESSDVMFAVDSIPAAFAISKHPFVIFSANIFAILGLRSLYFLLAHAEKMFAYLRVGVAIVLAFIGVKMLVAHYLHIDTLLSLSIVIGTILISILLSWIIPKRGEVG